MGLGFLAAALLGILAAGVAHGLNNPDNMVPATGGGGYEGHCFEGVIGDAQACQTDNRELYWYVEKGMFSTYSLEPDDIDVVKSVVINRFAAHTVLTQTKHGNQEVVFSGAGETDIIYQEGPVPSNYIGYTWCDDATNGTFYACDQHYIRIAPGEYDIGLTCHETGHAVGLMHGGAASPNVGAQSNLLGCLKNPPPNNEGLGANNRDNIDATY